MEPYGYCSIHIAQASEANSVDSKSLLFAVCIIPLVPMTYAYVLKASTIPYHTLIYWIIFYSHEVPGILVCSVFLLGLYFDDTNELLDPLHLHLNVQTGISSIYRVFRLWCWGPWFRYDNWSSCTHRTIQAISYFRLRSQLPVYPWHR